MRGPYSHRIVGTGGGDHFERLEPMTGIPTHPISHSLGVQSLFTRRRIIKRTKNAPPTLFVASPKNTLELKRKAVAQARHWRRKGALVRTIKTADGWLNYVSTQGRNRKYFHRQIPFRKFQDPLFGIDTPRLVSYLESQPDFKPNLSWQENLRMMGGEQAMKTLAELMNPEGVRRNKALAIEQETDIAKGWDEALIAQGFMGYEGGSEAEAVSTLDPSDDVFEILGIGTADEPENPVHDEMFDSWFDEGFDDWEESNEGKAAAVITTQTILEEQASTEATIGSTPISREMNDAFTSIFSDAIWGDEETITAPDGSIVFRPDLEQDMSPTLGFSQPDDAWITEQEGTSGFWTFIPNERGAMTEDEIDTRRAWLVADSLGTVLQAYAYEDGDDPKSEADSYEAIRQAYLFASEASGMEPYTREGYVAHGNLSPGLAVLDGTVTINSKGMWLGWDVAHTTEDHRLESGDYALFIDSEVVDQAAPETTAEITRNWVLPKWNPRSGRVQQKDPMRERLEGLIGDEGITAAQNQAQIVRARVAREQGGSAQEILDAMLNNRYIVKREDGTPVTKYMPDFQTALQTVSGFTHNDIGDAHLLMMKAPSNPDGTINETEEKVHAGLKWHEGKWLIDYEGSP